MGDFLATHKELLSKIIDWPFLLFILLCLAVFLFRKEMRSILGRGDITISWGEGRSIRVHDISEHLDQELDQIREELQILKEDVHKFHADSDEFVAESQPSENLSDEEREQAMGRMKSSLRHASWRWRSLERLGIIAGITQQEAVKILRGDPEVTLGQDKSGHPIAKLVHR